MCLGRVRTNRRSIEQRRNYTWASIYPRAHPRIRMTPRNAHLRRYLQGVWLPAEALPIAPPRPPPQRELLYQEMGAHYGVTWKAGNYDPSNWHLADNIDLAISTANSALYALTTSVRCRLFYGSCSLPPVAQITYLCSRFVRF